jgi:hypothetical protein
MIAYDMQMQIEQQSNIFEHEITKGNDFQKSPEVSDDEIIVLQEGKKE